MKNLLNKIKGLFDTQETLKDPNRSINYYRPDWVEPEEEEEDYKKWKAYINKLYTFDALKDFPPEFEFNNITDPYLAKGDASGRAAAVVHNIFSREDMTPRVEWNTDLIPKPQYVEHEKFHARQAEPSYFSDWNPLTARNFETASDWLGQLLRKASVAGRIGASKDDVLARSFTDALQRGGTYTTNPFSSADRQYAAEELGAEMYENNWHKQPKPYWMSDRDYQIMMNMISHRMGW